MPNLFGNIYNSELADNARFFESEAFKTRDLTQENKERVSRVSWPLLLLSGESFLNLYFFLFLCGK